ncbi:hypothetical protein ACL2XP_13690 [Sodalis sp. RH21]|uniref:mannitol dehydrogenase family protein n=1 Tax=unclassified Sodalis (in: enterobacteria) TaxID=2636512 RepID=UPI0039B5CF09
MKAIHFGAGSIGRGFIGDLLNEAGYAITFVDVNEQLNAQINQDSGYDLYIIEENFNRKFIGNVSARSPVTDKDDIIALFPLADVITTSVWADNLPRIAPLILAGLKERRRRSLDTINVIVCENAWFNGAILRREILKLDPQLTADELDAMARFPNTAVDRLVLNSRRAGKDTVDIGIEHELVIDRTGLADPAGRPISGAIYTDNLQKYLERKLYIINGGHAWAGYIGYVRGYDIIQDVFNNGELVAEVKSAMLETANLLHEKYDFPLDELTDYIDFAIGRFKTPGIKDTIARVCRSPIRKLAPDDRLTAPCVQCENAGLNNEKLLTGIAAALLFDNPDDGQCRELQQAIKEQGIGVALTRYTGITADSRMYNIIMGEYSELKKIKATLRN